MAGTAADGPYYLGIDVGGTNIKAGVVTAAGAPIGEVAKVKTERIAVQKSASRRSKRPGTPPLPPPG